MKTVTRQCHNCQIIFETSSNIYRKRKNYFCTHRCANSFNSKLRIDKRTRRARYVVNDQYFEIIDTEEKAYILGWIASDGHISSKEIKISVRDYDDAILHKIAKAMGTTCPVLHKKPNMSILGIYSPQMVKDVCRHLKLVPGPKDFKISLPNLSSDFLMWAYIRGHFEGDGHVAEPMYRNRPLCNIASVSKLFLQELQRYTQIKSDLPRINSVIRWRGQHAIDFLHKIYDTASIYLDRKHDAFLRWKNWSPGCKRNHEPSELLPV